MALSTVRLPLDVFRVIFSFLEIPFPRRGISHEMDQIEHENAWVCGSIGPSEPIPLFSTRGYRHISVLVVENDANSMISFRTMMESGILPPPKVVKTVSLVPYVSVGDEEFDGYNTEEEEEKEDTSNVVDTFFRFVCALPRVDHVRVHLNRRAPIHTRTWELIHARFPVRSLEWIERFLWLDAIYLFDALRSNTSLTSLSYKSRCPLGLRVPHRENGSLRPTIARLFTENTTLRELSIYSPIVFGKDFYYLDRNTTLTYLDLRGIGYGAVRYLTQGLKNNTSIRSLELHSVPYNVGQWEDFASMLCVNTTLTTIVLEKIFMRYEEIPSLYEILLPHRTLMDFTPPDPPEIDSRVGVNFMIS